MTEYKIILDGLKAYGVEVVSQDPVNLPRNLMLRRGSPNSGPATLRLRQQRQKGRTRVNGDAGGPVRI
jgi:hypothetical protein